MFDDLKANVKDWSNEDEIREYLLKLLNREAFDKAGLIYGMGDGNRAGTAPWPFRPAPELRVYNQKSDLRLTL